LEATGHIGIVYPLSKSRFRDKRLETLRGARWGADGRLVSIERYIDAANDAYRERVVEVAPGVVLRDIAEPLSQHVGRGTARRRGQKTE
jgi:hypothetical protein